MKSLVPYLFPLLLLSPSLLWAQPERFKKNADEDDSTEQEASPKSPEKAQKAPADSARPWYQDLVYGGNLGLQFGNLTSVTVVGQVGYHFTPQFMSGLGFNYNYLKINRQYDPFTNTVRNVNFSSQVYGPNFFANYFPFKQAFIGTQWELLNHDFFQYTSAGTRQIQNLWTPVGWVQAGYRQPFGDNGGYLLGLRYNLLHDQQSPYGRAWMPYIGIFF